MRRDALACRSDCSLRSGLEFGTRHPHVYDCFRCSARLCGLICFQCAQSHFDEDESVGLAVELMPAASSMVEEVRDTVTRVNQLLRTGWISANFDCNI